MKNQLENKNTDPLVRRDFLKTAFSNRFCELPFTEQRSVKKTHSLGFESFLFNFCNETISDILIFKI